MKRLLACLVLCASLSASAQGDNCTVLGIQDLTQMVLQLQAEIDSLKATGMTRDSVIAIAIHKELSIDEVTGGDLSTINLFDADLTGADLDSANLSRANLFSANLTNADLENADLSGANLQQAILSNANLSLADLTYARLQFAGLSGANFANADLTGANLSSSNLYGAFLGAANLSYADLTYANLTGAWLIYANVTGATMRCLQSCPSSLPPGYICELDTDCPDPEPGYFRIVPE